MYEPFESIGRIALEKHRQITQEAELFRLVTKQQCAWRKGVKARSSIWLGLALIEAGEWLLYYADQERRNVREHRA